MLKTYGIVSGLAPKGAVTMNRLFFPLLQTRAFRWKW